MSTGCRHSVRAEYECQHRQMLTRSEKCREGVWTRRLETCARGTMQLSALSLEPTEEIVTRNPVGLEESK